MSVEKITAYVTKYALTKGILTVEGRETDKGTLVCRFPGSPWDEYLWGKDWHRSPEDARADALRRKERRITSLKKSLAAMETKDVCKGLPA